MTAKYLSILVATAHQINCIKKLIYLSKDFVELVGIKKK